MFLHLFACIRFYVLAPCLLTCKQVANYVKVLSILLTCMNLFAWIQKPNEGWGLQMSLWLEAFSTWYQVPMCDSVWLYCLFKKKEKQ